MAMANTQQNFQARVRRLSKLGTKPRSAHIVGMTPTSPMGKSAPVAVELYMVPFALLMGALSILLARVIVFYGIADGGYLRIDGLEPYIGLLGDILIGAALFFLLGKIYRLGFGLRFWAQFTGFVGFMLFESELITRFPDIFSLIYSEPYVGGIIGPLASTL